MKHMPVLLNESIEYLDVKPDGIYLDGTLGRGGHTAEIAKRLKTGKVIAIDTDETAIEEAKENLKKLEDRIIFIHANFRDLSNILHEVSVDKVDGMLFDLGVSSPQLDDSSRGFSYMKDSKLDMRMDKTKPLTAFDVVNEKSEEALQKIFFEYGEERYSRQIAKKIVQRRSEAPIETTAKLSEIIISALPPAARREEQHPAKRVFQAIRIFVNDELSSIEEMLKDAPNLLKPQGRLCVISFHSLEDRIVKNSFKEHAQGCTCSKKIPVCICGKKPKFKIITKKPIVASDDEIKENPRARSAKLRVAECL